MNSLALPFQQTTSDPTKLNSDHTAFEVSLVPPSTTVGVPTVAILGSNIGSVGLPGNIGPTGVGVRGVSGFFNGVEGEGSLPASMAQASKVTGCSVTQV